MADIWGEVQTKPVYRMEKESSFDWFLLVLWAGILFFVARFILGYLLTGSFLSWHAMLLLLLFLVLPYLLWLLRGNEGWEGVVDHLFVAYCVYFFLSVVTFVVVLVA